MEYKKGMNVPGMNASEFVTPRCVDERKSVRLHLINITGLGTVRLLQSLLPSLKVYNWRQVM